MDGARFSVRGFGSGAPRKKDLGETHGGRMGDAHQPEHKLEVRTCLDRQRKQDEHEDEDVRDDEDECMSLLEHLAST